MKNIMLLYDKFNQIEYMGWVKSLGNGTAAIGITFERLIGKNIENFEIPDFEGIEIKVKSSNSKGSISLFNATPDSYLFEIKRIINEYGYPSKDNSEFKVFQISIQSKKFKTIDNIHNFKLCVNHKTQQVILNVYDKNFNLIDNKIRWSFDMLKEKLYRKFKILAVIKAQKRKINNEIYFKYNKINFYKLKAFDNFIELIENGNIKVTFKIGFYKDEKRYGNIYDHGTSFDISQKSINKLFENILINKK